MKLKTKIAIGVLGVLGFLAIPVFFVLFGVMVARLTPEPTPEQRKARQEQQLVRQRQREEAQRQKQAERAGRDAREAKDKAAQVQREAEERWESDSQKIAAFVMSQEFVKDRLRAPRTAEFSSYRDAVVRHVGDGVYEVRSHVDSQNAFGAMLRAQYLVKLRENSDQKKWTAIEVTVQ